jgi:SAM-dependent methyltransferase
MREKVVSQPCLRNQGPILEALSPWFKQGGRLLELACGTGQHGAFISGQVPQLHWQLSEHPSMLELSQPWVEEADRDNLPLCMALDISQDRWPIKTQKFDFAYCSNLLHFIGQEQVTNLFKGVANALKPSGQFFCYGPINENGFTSTGNESLDAWLKQEVDPLAGIKELSWLVDQASQHGLSLTTRLNLPANNVILVFENATE